MRENLEELNTRACPTRRCSSAAPRSRAPTSSATSARSTRGGSSTARTRSKACTPWTRSWRASAAANARPRLRSRARRPRHPAPRDRRRAGQDAALDDVPSPPTPTSPPTSPIFTPPFLGSRVAKGISLDDIAGVHQRDRAVPQPVAVPARQDARRDRHRLQGAHPRRRCAPSSTSAKAEGWLVPAVGVGLLPREQRRQRPRGLDRRRPPHRAPAVHVPAPARRPAPLHRRLLPLGRQRRRRLRRVPRRDRGRRAPAARARAVRRRPLPGVPAHPRAVGRDDRGARRALAPPHPRGVGLRRRGRPDDRRACSASSTAARATRGATRRAPTSRTRRSSTSCSSCTASA